MLDRLFDFIADFFELLAFITIVDEYERGIVLTLGKYRGRMLEPGYHWVWPFGIDSVLVDNVVPTTTNLDPQKLTTADGAQIIIGVAIRWNIRDIEKAALRVEDIDSVLDDSTYGEISAYVRDSTLEEINTDEWIQEVHAAIRKRAFRFGIEVEETWITDLIRTKVICLVD